MSILKCPIAIINRIEKLQLDFLWRGCKESNKIHLVNWKLVCCPKKSGDLGIRPLKSLNQALLGKWLWRPGDESEGLWRDILLAKYKVRRNGWDTSPSSQRCSNFLKGICSSEDSFTQSIRYKVGNGDNISFWHDIWVGNNPLAIQFPDLYRCARNHKAKVADYLITNGSQHLWGPIFSRNLFEAEEAHLFNLLEVLSGVDTNGEVQDIRVWAPSSNGSFSVSSSSALHAGPVYSSRLALPLEN